MITEPEIVFSEFQARTMTNRATEFLRDEIWRERIELVVEAFDEFDKGINGHLELTRTSSSALHRAIRYSVPIFEIMDLLGDGDSANQTARKLAATILWSELWRPLDDILDREAPVTEALLEYTQSLVRAEEFTRLTLGAAVRNRGSVYDYLRENIQIENDLDARGKYHETFKRARVFDTVDLFCQFPQRILGEYHNYINIIGFAHDFIDFLNDQKNGVNTPVQEIWRSIETCGGFSAPKAVAFSERCVEFINLEVLKYKSAFSTRPKWSSDSINDTCSWAFGEKFAKI